MKTSPARAAALSGILALGGLLSGCVASVVPEPITTTRTEHEPASLPTIPPTQQWHQAAVDQQTVEVCDAQYTATVSDDTVSFASDDVTTSELREGESVRLSDACWITVEMIAIPPCGSTVSASVLQSWFGEPVRPESEEKGEHQTMLALQKSSLFFDLNNVSFGSVAPNRIDAIKGACS